MARAIAPSRRRARVCRSRRHRRSRRSRRGRRARAWGLTGDEDADVTRAATPCGVASFPLVGGDATQINIASRRSGGVLLRWNDTEQSGFIKPNKPGAIISCNLSAFRAGCRDIAVGESLTFVVGGLSATGVRFAALVEPIRWKSVNLGNDSPRASRPSPAQSPSKEPIRWKKVNLDDELLEAPVRTQAMPRTYPGSLRQPEASELTLPSASALAFGFVIARSQ